MANILRLSKYIIAAIMIIAVIWIIHKKTESERFTKSGENRNNDISGFDSIMIGITGIMERVIPSSPLTREMTGQKKIIINHL